MPFLPLTTRYYRSRLPHWEVEHGRYFVTVHCHDSLPSKAITELVSIQRELARIAPRSEEFAREARRYRQTAEKYANMGTGSCPLKSAAAAAIAVAALVALEQDGVGVPHYSVMPNHWHALLAPARPSIDLHEVIMQLKGRTSRAINRALGTSGPLWQRDWFDHWIRNETEWDKCVAYIRNNPVKAGLVHRWQDHPWTR